MASKPAQKKSGFMRSAMSVVVGILIAAAVVLFVYAWNAPPCVLQELEVARGERSAGDVNFWCD
jgi:hypothetical protein